MIYIRSQHSQRPILVPYIASLPMCIYLETYIAPAANLTVKDGTVYEWIIHECEKGLHPLRPVFTRANKRMRVGETLEDGSTLFVTTGRPEHLYGNACFEHVVYTTVGNNNVDLYDVFSKMMGLIGLGLGLLLLVMVLMFKFTEFVNSAPIPSEVVIKPETYNGPSYIDELMVITIYFNWLMVITLYFVVRWMVTKIMSWF